MKLFVLIDEWEREGFALHGVFTTLENAQKVIPGEWSVGTDGIYYQYKDSNTRTLIFPIDADQFISIHP